MAQLAVQESDIGRFGLLKTRPATCLTSVGTGGTAIKVLSNYFAVLSQPDWKLYQYHVDYNPPIESRRLRLALMRNHETALFPNNKAFDGMTLYTTTLLPNDVFNNNNNNNFSLSPRGLINLIKILAGRNPQYFAERPVGSKNYYQKDSRDHPDVAQLCSSIQSGLQTVPETLRNETSGRRPQLLRHEREDTDQPIQSGSNKRFLDVHFQLRGPSPLVRRVDPQAASQDHCVRFDARGVSKRPAKFPRGVHQPLCGPDRDDSLQRQDLSDQRHQLGNGPHENFPL